MLIVKQIDKGDSGAPFPDWALSKAALSKWMETRVTSETVALVITGKKNFIHFIYWFYF